MLRPGSAFLATMFVSVSLFAQTPNSKLAGPTNEDGRKHYERAEEWLQTRNISAAVDEYRKAYEADPQCIRCAVKGIQDAVNERDYKAVIKFADIVLAHKSPELIRFATLAKGHMLLLDGEQRKKQDQIEQAHAVFTGWLAEHPGDADIIFDDGVALSHLNKDTEAAAQFTYFAKIAPASDARKLRAVRMAERPELARARMAPSFSAKDINGIEVSPDSLTGRVVLIDFWATWCGPCNEELPHIKRIAQAYANQPLTVISISWDKDADKWKQFVTKNGMTWTQVRDGDHSITDKFGIDAIPHYFTIDTDGVLQAEQLGTGSSIDGKLKKMVAEAVKHQQQMAVTSSHGN